MCQPEKVALVHARLVEAADPTCLLGLTNTVDAVLLVVAAVVVVVGVVAAAAPVVLTALTESLALMAIAIEAQDESTTTTERATALRLVVRLL